MDAKEIKELFGKDEFDDLTGHLIPDNIINCILEIRRWAKKNNHNYWTLGDITYKKTETAVLSEGTSEEDILEEASRITSGDRQNQYGPADQDFKRTAQMWSAIKGVEFTPKEVAMFLICLKLSRETHQKKRDNWVDIAGYAKCGSICEE